MNSESLEPITSALTTDEQSELSACESRIERGIDSALDCVEAFRTVHDKQLWRGEYANFEDYCRRRWGKGRAQSYRLLASALVRDNVPEIGNERQARVLSSLEPDIQRSVYTIAETIAPKDAEDHPIISANLLEKVSEGVAEELRDVLQGHMTDSQGEQRPLSKLSEQMTANVINRVRETYLQQAEEVRGRIDRRTQKAHESGEPKQVPAQSAPVFLTYLIRENVRAMDKYIGDKGALHPALFNVYHLSKAILGEGGENDEVDFMTDPVAIPGLCERCGHNGEEPVRLSVITARSNGHMRSIKMLLCGFCVSVYSKMVDSIPEKAVEA